MLSLKFLFLRGLPSLTFSPHCTHPASCPVRGSVHPHILTPITLECNFIFHILSPSLCTLWGQVFVHSCAPATDAWLAVGAQSMLNGWNVNEQVREPVPVPICPVVPWHILLHALAQVTAHILPLSITPWNLGGHQGCLWGLRDL